MPIRNLQYFAMSVPDLQVGRRFYTDFGLNAQERDGKLILRCDERDQDQIVLIEGAPKRLHHVCFGTTADDLPQLQKNIEDAGVKLIDPPKEAEGSGIWFTDFDDMMFNIKVADEAPWVKGYEATINTPTEREARCQKLP